MKLSPRWREVVLVTHVTTAVGWLGADAVLLVLGIAGLTGAAGGPDTVYPVAGLIGTVLITPLALAALVTGLVSGLGTKWGLVRHWWVAVKLVVTVVMNVLVACTLLLFTTVLSVAKPWNRTARGRVAARRVPGAA